MTFKRFATGLLTLGLLAFAMPMQAQDAQDPNQAKLEKKLALPFISKGGWHTDFESAKKAAAEQGKPIFAYFTRSYAP